MKLRDLLPKKREINTPNATQILNETRDRHHSDARESLNAIWACLCMRGWTDDTKAVRDWYNDTLKGARALDSKQRRDVEIKGRLLSEPIPFRERPRCAYMLEKIKVPADVFGKIHGMAKGEKIERVVLLAAAHCLLQLQKDDLQTDLNPSNNFTAPKVDSAIKTALRKVFVGQHDIGRMIHSQVFSNQNATCDSGADYLAGFVTRSPLFCSPDQRTTGPLFEAVLPALCTDIGRGVIHSQF